MDDDSIKGEKKSLLKDLRSTKYKKRVEKDRKKEAKKQNYFDK